jgi:tetratricopeptide (TPR) repeat protein
VRALRATALTLLLGTEGVAIAQSSSISPEDSSSIEEVDLEEADRRNREWARGTLEEKAPAGKDSVEVREAVEGGNWERALELVREQMERTPAGPGRARLGLLEARLLAALGDARSAVEGYRLLLDDPEMGDRARAELHDFLVRRGEFDAADSLTAAAAEPGPDADPALAALRATARAAAGRYTEAARLAQEGTLRGIVEASVVRANALLALGSDAEAEELYLEVLGEATDRKVRQAAHFGLGQVARLRGGRAVRALQDERAVRLGPAPWAELDWGLALRALGRRDEARTRLENVASGYPELASTARLGLARLDEEEGRAGEGLEELAASLHGSVGDFLVLTRLGELLLQEGLEDAGIDAHRASLLLFPEFPAGRALLTRALTSRGRWDEAPAPDDEQGRWQLQGWTWDRLLDGDLPFYGLVADRDSVAVEDPRRFVLALIHLRAGNAAGALGWSEGATVGQSGLLAIRAEALELAGRPGEAVQAWEALLEAGEGGPVARERLARLVFPADPDRAMRLWREQFERYPEFPRARLRMAEALEEAGELQQAIDAYRETETAGWLSPAEKRRIRVAIEDVESLLQEQEDAKLDNEG